MASIQDMDEAINLIKRARTYIIDHHWSTCNCNRCDWVRNSLDLERRYNEYRQREGNQKQTETQTEPKTNQSP